MRRGNKRKFGRTTDKRHAFMNSLATSLIEHGRITTTRTRAKALASYIGRLVTTAKSSTVTSRRSLATSLHHDTVRRLTDEIAPKLKDRVGGYTRTTNLPVRKSDGAEMSIIEFVS